MDLLALSYNIDDFLQEVDQSWYEQLLTNELRKGMVIFSEILTIISNFHQIGLRNFKYYYIELYVAISTRRLFVIKLHLVVNQLECCVMLANVDDHQTTLHLTAKLANKLYADIEGAQPLVIYLWQHGLHLITKMCTNMKNRSLA